MNKLNVMGKRVRAHQTFIIIYNFKSKLFKKIYWAVFFFLQYHNLTMYNKNLSRYFYAKITYWKWNKNDSQNENAAYKSWLIHACML